MASQRYSIGTPGKPRFWAAVAGLACWTALVAGGTASAVVQERSKKAPAEQANPFSRRLDIAEFPRDLDWLNTRPLKLQDLRGKFVLLDFWTYCCINCMHILPELKKLEQAYPNQLVVIGVHSAKFDTERETDNIAEAILRYNIEHPVVNDDQHLIWDNVGVSSWPTIILIDPEGKMVWGRPGEFEAKEVDDLLKAAIPYYRGQKLLDESPVHFELLEINRQPTPLKFPGKVLADEASNRLFVADSNHHRVVVSDLQGKVLGLIGSGNQGDKDGGFDVAEFDDPQGLALRGDFLYIADTDNHRLRKADLKRGVVTTVAGDGQQTRNPWPGLERRGGNNRIYRGKPKATSLSSPWDLWIHQDDLYIAMAGTHQIWKMTLDENWIGPYAGDGFEDIVDGRLLPAEPPALRGWQKEAGDSSFAQPSGLTSDGKSLFVADSEGSSVRAVALDAKGAVTTLIGTANLPQGRLFTFGDVDGPPAVARLQHGLAVAYHEGSLFIADTYNNKIKVLQSQAGRVKTVAGDGKPGKGDSPPQFDEPAGLSIAKGVLYIADTNNHAIRTLNLASGEVNTMAFSGLSPPQPPAKRPDFANALRRAAAPQKLKPQGGQVHLQVALDLAEGLKINELAPMSYWVSLADGAAEGPLPAAALGRKPVAQPSALFTVSLPVSGVGETQIELAFNYYYCGVEGGLCKVGSVVITVPLVVAENGQETAVLRPLAP